MKFITITVDDKSYAQMLKGKRVEGTVGFDRKTSMGDLNAFKRKSREPGYVRPKDVMLGESASGWLKMSVKKFKIFVSANNRMERERAATEILRQAKELADHLKNTKSIEEIMNEI